MAPEPQKQLVLILGASGKVGRMLRSVWSESPVEGIDFAYVYRQMTNEQSGYIWHPGLSSDKLPSASTIVALWGVTPGSKQEFEENSELAISALELAQELGVKRVLHCSSAAVYEPSREPLLETSSTNAPNDYGRSKLAMEVQIAKWMSTRSAEFSNVFLRMANVAGGDSLFNNMKPGQTIVLDRFPDGQGPRRSYIGPVELAQAIEKLIKTPQFEGPINVAAPYPVAMDELAKEAGCSIEWKPAPAEAIASVSLDTTKLQKLLRLEDQTADPKYLIETARIESVWP